MMKLFPIAAGGALGAMLRYWMSGFVHRFFSSTFPWGTLSVNLIGSLVIGFVWGISEAVIIPQTVRLFILIGILGAFTTFSTFSLENFTLLRDGEYWLVITNVSVSVLGGILLVFGGYLVSRLLIGGLK